MSCCYSCCPADIDEHEDEEDLLCPDPPPGRRILWDYIILDEGHKVRRQSYCLQIVTWSVAAWRFAAVMHLLRSHQSVT